MYNKPENKITSKEFELYKLITMPNKDYRDITYVSQFMWTNVTEFLIWLKYEYMQVFMSKCQKIFEHEISCKIVFDQNAQISNTAICVNLSSMIENCDDDIKKQIDLNNIFQNRFMADHCKAIIAKKLETTLTERGIKKGKTIHLKWNDDGKTAQISLDDKIFGTFDYSVEYGLTTHNVI